jgi:Arc/MetJ-type ribon-helix-helix transcriptional regulator
MAYLAFRGEGVYDVRMKRVNYHLTEEQIAWLDATSERTGLSVAELIRRAVDAMREREEKRRKREGK